MKRGTFIKSVIAAITGICAWSKKDKIAGPPYVSVANSSCCGPKDQSLYDEIWEQLKERVNKPKEGNTIIHFEKFK